MSEDRPEGEEDALQESAGQRAVQRREPVAKVFSAQRKMEPEPHIGEITIHI